MFAKTVCKPGATITVVPVGLLTTIQYNANGILEKVFSGYGELKVDITTSTKEIIQKNKLVPGTVNIKGGTTWVEGVFYTPKKFYESGYLPHCIKDAIISDMQSNPSDYMFYAGRVYSLGASVTGANNIKTWLQLSRFTLLPSFICPTELSSSYIKEQLDRNKLVQFNYPMLSGLMIFENGSYRYIPSGLKQVSITKVENLVSSEGYIQAKLHDSEGQFDIVHYSDVITFNIQKGTTVVKDRDNHIIDSFSSTTNVKPKISDVIVCKYCGNLFRAPKSGPVMCTDDQCKSRMYPVISHMLKVFNLKPLSFSAFQEHLKKNDILSISDVLQLPKYKDIKIVTDLCKLIEACVPVEVCANNQVFRSFVNMCFNSVSTFRYYLNNPTKLVNLEATDIFMFRFKEWICDPSNRLTLLSVLDSPNIIIDNSNIKQFDGPAIFRGKHILLTGTFSHGDHETVAAILRSYSATIATEFQKNIDCLIIGDLKHNINGKAISEARMHDVPIFTESEFFSKYEIDEDLKKNLL